MKKTCFTEEQIVNALRAVETGGKKAIDQRVPGRAMPAGTSGSASMAAWK